MKIAINTRFLLPNQTEGIGRYTEEIVRRMVELCPQDEFYLLFDRELENLPEWTSRENVTIKVVNPPARHPILWKIWYEISVPKVLKKIGAELFISMDGYTSIKAKIQQE